MRIEGRDGRRRWGGTGDWDRERVYVLPNAALEQEIHAYIYEARVGHFVGRRRVGQGAWEVMGRGVKECGGPEGVVFG